MAKNMELDIDSVLKGTGANRTFSSEDKKERMGRPRLEEADKANKRITLYCTEAEYNFIILQEEFHQQKFIPTLAHQQKNGYGGIKFGIAGQDASLVLLIYLPLKAFIFLDIACFLLLYGFFRVFF